MTPSPTSTLHSYIYIYIERERERHTHTHIYIYIYIHIQIDIDIDIDSNLQGSAVNNSADGAFACTVLIGARPAMAVHVRKSFCGGSGVCTREMGQE